LSAFRRSRGLRAASDAARADVTARRERSASQVARDYLEALRADSAGAAARAGAGLAETLLGVAQDSEDAGKAAIVEVTRAKLRLATDRRKLAGSENDRVQARLQLLNDLGLDFDTPLELTDNLTYATEAAGDEAGTVTAALHARPELQMSQKRRRKPAVTIPPSGSNECPP